MKKYIISILLVSMVWSCDDFLEEKQVSTLTQDFYNTETGLEGLIKSLYVYARVKHEWSANGASLIEPETDAYMTRDYNFAQVTAGSYGSDVSAIASNVNNFLGAANSNYAPMGAYPHINNCNIALEQIDNVKPGRFGTDEAFNKARKAEVLFLRAWAYYLVSNQLGDVPLLLTAKREDNGIYHYPKASIVDVYKRIIADMRFAYENLPPTQSDRGRVTKWAAGHFLAKLYLHRAQAAAFQNSAEIHLKMLYKGGNETSDLDSVITVASQVIAAVGALAPDYWTLFNPDVSETSPHAEVLWSAQFDENTGLNGRFGGNRSCNYHIGAFEHQSGVARSLEYGRPFATYKPSDWAFDNFRDKVNDSRYAKTFMLDYIGNATNSMQWSAASAAWWNANKPADAPAVTAGQAKVIPGKRALAFVENHKEDALDSATVMGQPFLLVARWIHSAKTGKYYYRIYPNGESIGLAANATRGNIYLSSKKYIDPKRGGGNIASESGTRDAILMRLAETYLIRAEAYGRKSQYGLAVDDINVLRKRAAYKPGETRSEFLVQWEPTAASLPAADLVAPYAASGDPSAEIMITENVFTPSTPEADAEGYIPTVTTKESMFIHFIYNERAREFLSEGIAWEDQHNAGILYDRVVHLNQMASPLTGLWPVADNPENGNGQNGNGKGQYQKFHTFRPWPNAFLTLLTDENGNPLDENGRQAYQNPGY